MSNHYRMHVHSSKARARAIREALVELVVFVGGMIVFVAVLFFASWTGQ